MVTAGAFATRAAAGAALAPFGRSFFVLAGPGTGLSGGLGTRFLAHFLFGQLAVAIAIQLIEQRDWRSGKFAIVDAAIAIPVDQRRRGRFVRILALLVDGGDLVVVQTASVTSVGSGEFGLQARFQFLSLQYAVMIDVIVQEDGDRPAAIILVTRFLGRPHPGGHIVAGAAASTKSKGRGKGDNGGKAQGGFPSFCRSLAGPGAFGE